MRLILFMLFAYLLEDFVVYSDIAGYYWRDYYGEIPDDAFPGGIDVNGDPIYIGQNLHDSAVIPGKIYGSTKKSTFEFGIKEHEVTKNVKILCTTHPEKLEWIPTSTQKLKTLKNVHLIQGGGGYPAGTLYIGRVRYKGEVLVGKVYLVKDGSSGSHGVWITSIDKTASLFDVFEVLSFNKNAQSIIDTRTCT